MAFEIGERVTNSFSGPGTVTGPMTRDEDGEPYQMVKYDSPLSGERSTRIAKLNPYQDPAPRATRLHLLENTDPAAVVHDYESPLFADLLPKWSDVKSVRIIAPAKLEEDTRRLFTDLKIVFPVDWRGTEKGKRNGKTEQRSISASIEFADGSRLNNTKLALKLLAEGRLSGWRVTQSA